MNRDDSFGSDDHDISTALDKSYEQEPRRLPSGGLSVRIGLTGFFYDSKTIIERGESVTLHSFTCRACGRKSVWLRDLAVVEQHADIHADPLNCDGRRGEVRQ